MAICITSEAVIPALYRAQGKLQQESRVSDRNRDPEYNRSRLSPGQRLDSPVSSTGAGLVTPVMTRKAKEIWKYCDRKRKTNIYWLYRS